MENFIDPMSCFQTQLLDVASRAVSHCLVVSQGEVELIGCLIQPAATLPMETHPSHRPFAHAGAMQEQQVPFENHMRAVLHNPQYIL